MKGILDMTSTKTTESADTLGAETVVGPTVKIQGELNSEGNIKIEGQVTGKIATTQSVYLGQASKIIADITAGNAIIAGEVQGNIKVSGNLVIQGTGKIKGDISCSVLRVEDGALFTGKCSMNGANKVTLAPETDTEIITEE